MPEMSQGPISKLIWPETFLILSELLDQSLDFTNNGNTFVKIANLAYFS